MGERDIGKRNKPILWVRRRKSGSKTGNRREKRRPVKKDYLFIYFFCTLPLFGLEVGPQGNKIQWHSHTDCRVSGDVCPALLFCRAELPGP